MIFTSEQTEVQWNWAYPLACDPQSFENLITVRNFNGKLHRELHRDNNNDNDKNNGRKLSDNVTVWDDIWMKKTEGQWILEFDDT